MRRSSILNYFTLLGYDLSNGGNESENQPGWESGFQNIRLLGSYKYILHHDSKTSLTYMYTHIFTHMYTHVMEMKVP